MAMQRDPSIVRLEAVFRRGTGDTLEGPQGLKGEPCATFASLSAACRPEGRRYTANRRGQNFVNEEKLNSRTFMAGTTISNDSSPAVR